MGWRLDDLKWALGLPMVLVVAILMAACSGPAGTADPFAQDGERPTITPSQLEGTEWLLTLLNGDGLVEDSSITLGFYPGSYLEGSAGCNSFGTNYEAKGGEFSVSVIHRTGISCDVAPSILEQEAAFFKAMENVAVYHATEDVLAFAGPRGETLLQFARKRPAVVDPALEDTGWLLALLHGETLLEGSQITLNFGGEGLGGFASCNQYGGEYDAASDGVLIVPAIWQTEMECPTDGLVEQERAYIEALGRMASYRITGDRLELGDASGETILVFSRKEEFQMDASDLVGTGWRLVTTEGKSPIEGSTLTLYFHNEYRVSGHAGCRDYLATYEASGDDLAFPFFALIEAGCSGDEALLVQEGQFTEILGWACSYRMDEGQLEITTERGETLAFEALPEDAGAGLESTQWRLAALVDEQSVEGMAGLIPRVTERRVGTEATVTFEDGALSGSAGCNLYSARYALDGSSVTVGTLTMTERVCLDPEGVMVQERRMLSVLEDVTSQQRYYNQLWLETGDGRALLFAAGRNCLGPDAFPAEEAELVLPTLVEVQPAQAAPGEQVEVLGVGGNLYWENECGSQWIESAQDFQLLLDGEPAGSIQCYAGSCRARLTIPAEMVTGAHTISAEGGSSLDIEVVD